MASLWKVDDEATAELMKRFYEGMFRERLTPAAALRAAQVSMWQQRRWHAPYYWASFVLAGPVQSKRILAHQLLQVVHGWNIGLLNSRRALHFSLLEEKTARDHFG